MNRRRRAVSSARRSSAWLVVAGGLVLYSVAVVIFALTGISPMLLLPWWIAQAVPPLVYALLIGVCVRPVSVSRWLGGTGLLWAIHVLLGILTAGVVASIGAWSVDLSSVEAFPPPLIPEILWVPLLLRSEEHTSELQSRENLVCRLLLEKKNGNSSSAIHSISKIALPLRMSV